MNGIHSLATLIELASVWLGCPGNAFAMNVTAGQDMQMLSCNLFAIHHEKEAIYVMQRGDYV